MSTNYTADQLVNAWIIKRFHAHDGHTMNWSRNRETEAHLQDCPSIRVKESEGSDGVYGCDTGCEYARLEATLTCEHGMEVEFEYGMFGELSDILEEIATDAKAGTE